eukprot:scaffold3100_cov403-Prasinococcus_capsulatus_cf.AAC.3
MLAFMLFMLFSSSAVPVPSSDASELASSSATIDSNVSRSEYTCILVTPLQDLSSSTSCDGMLMLQVHVPRADK